ncbi:ATPase [Sulfitobacter sp. F26169L]|uniref:ATPase n=1 Tax=Sulfitobacter sp. F26169L TaxID=2996015 RepID=UPI002260A998|nr:ATPase [Sulfitobacter sp. F26169L]MCX7565363.1 ATPase [Sulfitobacter sp. F26169L]
MLYPDAKSWHTSARKSVLFFGMSGLGKTHVSNLLVQQGGWFHYSVDYRIGTNGMYQHIKDNLIAHAMRDPFLAELLRADAMYLEPNVHNHDLTAVASYLGKPGDPARGGLPMEEYRRRQQQFRTAEIAALNDTQMFRQRAQDLYGYPHFICDTGGSICEWIDPEDDNDPLLANLSAQCLLVWIKGDEAHSQELIRRFDRAPKPMAYQPEFLERVWENYLNENKLQEDEVDPDSFIRWTYAQALAHRQPRYAAMARHGITVSADEIHAVTCAQDFDDLVTAKL